MDSYQEQEVAKSSNIISVESVASRIMNIRGHRIIIDADLASLYGVSTRVLNQAVKRNIDRFPHDFMFTLAKEEKEEVVTNCDHLSKLKYSSHLPNAFTEHGAIMAATILNSPKAVEMSIFVVRAFVRLREMFSSQKQLASKLIELEQKLSSHDRDIAMLIDAIRQLMVPPVQQRRQIGFVTDQDK
jgi:hypothetical protein